MLFLTFLGIVSLTSCYPMPYDPMENPNLFQGDILGIDSSDERSALPRDSQLWPGGVLPYVIDPGLDLIKDNVRQAMDHIEDKTCLRFVPKGDHHKDYLNIHSGQGCNAHVGYRRSGPQKVSLDMNGSCRKPGIIIHELVHAVGFFHEQNRSDRDEYINIFWENIIPGAESQFVKMKPHQNRLLTPYNYDSIMQYGEMAASKRRGAKTMTAKQTGVRLVGAKDKYELSEVDVTRINMLYKCKQ